MLANAIFPATASMSKYFPDDSEADSPPRNVCWHNSRKFASRIRWATMRRPPATELIYGLQNFTFDAVAVHHQELV